MAIMTEDSHLEYRSKAAFESCPALLNGSTAQTSPLLPENKQRVSTPLNPKVLLKPSSKTLPPLSHRRARVGRSVNYYEDRISQSVIKVIFNILKQYFTLRCRIAASGGWTSFKVLTSFPSFISYSSI